MIINARYFVQAAGGVGGAIAILQVMPAQFQYTLGGPSIRVDLHTAAMAEGILTLLINLAALVIAHRIQAGKLVQTWLLAMAIVTLIVSGSDYTGAAMNPAAVSMLPLVTEISTTYIFLHVLIMFTPIMCIYIFVICFSCSC